MSTMKAASRVASCSVDTVDVRNMRGFLGARSSPSGVSSLLSTTGKGTPSLSPLSSSLVSLLFFPLLLLLYS
jgi:hypothetical protein